MLGAGPAGAQGRIAEVCVPGICGQAPVLAREPAVDGCPADLCRFPAPLAVESLIAAARRSEVFSCSRRTRARPVTARSARSRARGLRAERLVHGADRGIDNPVAARAMVPRRSRQRGRAVSITVSPVLSAVDSQASPCARFACFLPSAHPWPSLGPGRPGSLCRGRAADGQTTRLVAGRCSQCVHPMRRALAEIGPIPYRGRCAKSYVARERTKPPQSAPPRLPAPGTASRPVPVGFPVKGLPSRVMRSSANRIIPGGTSAFTTVPPPTDETPRLG